MHTTDFPIEGPFRKLPVNDKRRKDLWAIYGRKTDKLVCFVFTAEKANMVLEALNFSWEYNNVGGYHKLLPEPMEPLHQMGQ